MRLVLDTNVFFWAVAAPERCPPRVRHALADRANELMVSALSAWEIAYKVRIARFPAAAGFPRRIPSYLAELGATELPLSLDHALAAGGLDWPHRDPFDRMIVAQAILEGATLVTSDRAILDYPGVRTLW